LTFEARKNFSVFNRFKKFIFAKKSRSKSFKKVSPRISIGTERGRNGSDKARIIGKKIYLSKDTGILNFLFKNSFVGVGSTDITLSIN